MTREEKLEAIYAEMANKELTLGCYYCSEVTRQQEVYDGSIGSNYIGEIIGHPVMIGDVLSYFERKDRIMTSVGEFEGTIENPTCIKEEYHIRDKIAKILYLYTSKTEPIEKQPNECIDYVYSLIQKD